MKINLQSVKQLAILGLASLVISCGGGDGAVPTPPPVIPEGTITGTVMLGVVKGATVTVYHFDSKTLLPIKSSVNPQDTASSRTDLSGKYTLNVKESAEFTPILICASSGQYQEPAGVLTGTEKRFETSELCAVSVFTKGDKEKVVNITHFTHMAYGLLLKKIDQGAPNLLDIILTQPAVGENPPEKTTQPGAISLSNAAISGWLQLVDDVNTDFVDDIITVTPVNFQNPQISNQGFSLKNEFKYGLAITSLSSLVDWITTVQDPNTGKVESGLFNGGSSIQLAQLAFDDIKDGTLDGFVSNTRATMASIKMATHIWRHHFSLRMYSVIVEKVNINRTGLVLDDVQNFVNHVSKYKSEFFNPAASVTEVTGLKPEFGHAAGLDTGILIKGSPEITVSIYDVAGIETATLAVLDSTGQPVSPTFAALLPDVIGGVNSIYTWTLETNGAVPIPDGVYTIEITATDYSGASDTLTTPGYTIGNNDLQVVITDPELTTSASINPDNAVSGKIITFSADITDNFGPSIVTFKILDTQNNVVATLPTIIGQNTVTTNLLKYTTTYDTTASLTDGKYLLEVHAISGLDVNATPGQERVKPVTRTRNFAIDKTVPDVRLDIPGNLEVGKLQIVNFTGTISDPLRGTTPYASKLSNYFLLADGSSQQAITAGPTTNVVNLNYPIPNGAQGWHKFRLSASDIAGNSNQSNEVIYGYDTIPPEVTITNQIGLGNKWYNTAFKYNGSIIDRETGISAIKHYFVDQANNKTNVVDIPGVNIPLPKYIIGEVITANLNNQTVSTFPQADGVYTYSIEASDIFSTGTPNVGTGQISAIGIDRARSTLTITPSSTIDAKVNITPATLGVTTLVNVSATTNASASIVVDGVVTDPGTFVGASPQPTATASGVKTVVAASTANTASSSFSVDLGVSPVASHAFTDSTAALSLALPRHSYKASGTITKRYKATGTCINSTQVGVTAVATGKCVVQCGTTRVVVTSANVIIATPGNYVSSPSINGSTCNVKSGLFYRKTATACSADLGGSTPAYTNAGGIVTTVKPSAGSGVTHCKTALSKITPLTLYSVTPANIPTKDVTAIAGRVSFTWSATVGTTDTASDVLVPYKVAGKVAGLSEITKSLPYTMTDAANNVKTSKACLTFNITNSSGLTKTIPSINFVTNGATGPRTIGDILTDLVLKAPLPTTLLDPGKNGSITGTTSTCAALSATVIYGPGVTTCDIAVSKTKTAILPYQKFTYATDVNTTVITCP